MTTGARFAEATRGVLHEALNLYRDDPRGSGLLRAGLDRLAAPLRIAVAGSWRSGRSTLLNAILGEEVAPVDLGEGSPDLTWYQDGPELRAIAYSSVGPPQELPVSRSATGLRVDVVGWRPAEIDDVVVQWPTRALRQTVLIDTAAIGGGPDGAPAVLDRIPQVADAVLYLTRDVRGSDLRAMESLAGGSGDRAGPVNLLMVLSRADEIGGGRVDALVNARQLARRHRRDPLVSSLSVGVVSVSGLIGLAGRVLSESDFAVLAALAGVPRPQLDPVLLSADRFATADLPVRVGPEVRRALLDRLGLFGVRLAVTLVRTGCDSRSKLSAELIQRSGLAELRESIGRSFIDRREVLKARSALATLEQLLRGEPRPGAPALLARVEQILAGAHDLHELRLLAAIQDSRVRFDAELTAEAHRLLGGSGVDVTTRLGMHNDATGPRLWDLAFDALRRWQHQAEARQLRLPQRRAARTVVRSCEQLLVELDDARRWAGETR